MKTKWFFTLVLSLVLHLAASARAAEEWVAHEWGTFTSVQGADGVQLEWNPLIKTDLPAFVYDRVRNRGGLPLMDYLLKGTTPGLLRMETPVIYFYSDRERTADVRVDFPRGQITEWYPQATRVGPYGTTNAAEIMDSRQTFIEWQNVQVLPRATKEISADRLIRETKDPHNHYYAAREVDANFLRVASPRARTGAEYERDLFYRGLGMMPAPLTLTLHGNEDQLVLSTTNREPLTDLFVLQVRGGTAWFHRLNQLQNVEKPVVRLNDKKFRPLIDVQPKLMQVMVESLVRQGLYEKEARAMVQTWKDQWFTEEGLRVLYLLPREWTDRTLPLHIAPAPASTVRVMVGRAEMITPTMEWHLLREVVRYSSGDEAAQHEAVRAVKNSGLGRFIEPATRKVLGAKPNKHFAEAAWQLARKASDGAIAVPELDAKSAKVAGAADLNAIFSCFATRQEN